jgi:hypothetical protein
MSESELKTRDRNEILSIVMLCPEMLARPKPPLTRQKPPQTRQKPPRIFDDFIKNS